MTTVTTFATATHGFPGTFGQTEGASGLPVVGSQGRVAGWMARLVRRAQQRLEEHALENVLKQLPRIDARAHADIERAAARVRLRHA